MKAKLSQEEKDRIFTAGFEYLKNYGIENSSLRSIAEGIGCSPANLYNYFENKDECVIEIAKYGFIRTANALVEYAMNNISALKIFFDTFLEELDKHIDDLRTVYQVATSPVYGERMRCAANELQPSYLKLIRHLARLMNSEERIIYPVIFNFISIILDYAVWRDRECTEIQLADLYETMVIKFKISKL